jgi:hypothetical protein
VAVELSVIKLSKVTWTDRIINLQGCHYLAVVINFATEENKISDLLLSSRRTFANQAAQVSKLVTHSTIRQDADSTRSGPEIPGTQPHVPCFE